MTFRIREVFIRYMDSKLNFHWTNENLKHIQGLKQWFAEQCTISIKYDTGLQLFYFY